MLWMLLVQVKTTACAGMTTSFVPLIAGVIVQIVVVIFPSCAITVNMRIKKGGK